MCSVQLTFYTLSLTSNAVIAFHFHFQSLVWRMTWGSWNWAGFPATTSTLNVSFAAENILAVIGLMEILPVFHMIYRHNRWSTALVAAYNVNKTQTKVNRSHFFMWKICQAELQDKSSNGPDYSDTLRWTCCGPGGCCTHGLCCACPGINPRVKSGRFMKLLPDYEHMDYKDVYTHCRYNGLGVQHEGLREWGSSWFNPWPQWP